MSSFLPRRPAALDEAAPEATHVDPRRQQIWIERRWQTQAARWRAQALAEAIFGGEVLVRITGGLLEGRFRGLLHLDVPFDDLELHREREARFAAASGQDSVLRTVPFVYVFSARETR